MGRSLLLSKKGAVLLVIDLQEKFSGAVPRFDEIVANTARLVLTFQMYGMPILVTEQYPAGLGSTVKPVRQLFPFLEIIEKMEFAATENEHFWPRVSALKADTFVVCGIETHVCINQTVIKLIEKGMQVHVVADAVASRNALDHNVALRKMERAGANIATTEMCLFELTEKAGTESFKNIQRMVRGKFSVARSLSALNVSPGISYSQPGENTATGQPLPEALSETVGRPPDGSVTQSSNAAPDDVLDMIDGAEAPASTVSHTSGAATPEIQEEKDAEIARVDALLETIDSSGEPSKPSMEKSEAQIDKEIKDIDNLLGNLGLADGEGK